MTDGKQETHEYAVFDMRGFTMGHGHLSEVERALQDARRFIAGTQGALPVAGSTWEDVGSRQDVLAKLEESLSNHLPSVRDRLTC